MDESKHTRRRWRTDRPETRQWDQLATEARDAVRLRNDRESSQKVYADFASKHGLKVSTLGRYLRALHFLEEVAKPGTDWSKIRPTLQTASVTNVELLARWHSYDAQSALSAARKLAERGHTVASLRKAESEARGSSTPRLLKSYRHQLREQAARWLGQRLGPEFDRQRVVRTDPAVDVLFAAKDCQRIGALLADPFPDRPIVSKSSEFMTRLLGSSLVLNQVVGLVPESLREECEQWIERNLRSVPHNLSVYWFPSGSFRDFRPEFFAGFELLLR
jgi:hypothetical protein